MKRINKEKEKHSYNIKKIRLVDKKKEKEEK